MTFMRLAGRFFLVYSFSLPSHGEKRAYGVLDWQALFCFSSMPLHSGS